MTREYLTNFGTITTNLGAMNAIGRPPLGTNLPILAIEIPIEKTEVEKSGNNYTETHLGNSPAADVPIGPLTLVNERLIYLALGHHDGTNTMQVPAIGTPKQDANYATIMSDDGDEEIKYLLDAMIKSWKIAWTSFSWEFNAALIGCEHGYYAGTTITGKDFPESIKSIFDGIASVTWGGNTLNIGMMEINGTQKINPHYNAGNTGMFDELSSTNPSGIFGGINLIGIDANIRTDIAAGTAQTLSFIMTKSKSTQTITFTLTNCKIYGLNGITASDTRAQTNFIFSAEEITGLNANGLTVNVTNFPNKG